ncbi:unnamed protein product [Arabis nemorensis]|uniref:PCI domain-containing protein n=1 Tax=Arabis nemorensis TaxID=586526 RepID=A0A565C9R5_9BRAS|nr:unnamed protein product [Arabis nemorensis]
MAIFPNPENAIKRADELVNIGQKQEALQMLHDLVTSRSFRSWQKPHEKIMFRYMELCVELRRGLFAKDGLIQYRNSCQQVNVSSFEEVTKHFLWLVTEKARSQADALEEEEEAFDVDELETDRSYLEVVTPWLKFSWEAYRTVLEISRNNSKLEALYAMTAHKAFEFCKQYKRTTEFRRLCEVIRNHLANLNKYGDQRDQPDLTVPESLELYLNTRFEQLNVATELGLWQKDLQLIASSVVLAALSVPPFGQTSHSASHSELENEKDHNLKMANLIDFNLEPKLEGRDMLSRASLLSELVLSCATQEVKDLYHLLEHEFQPLDLGSKVKPLLDRISKLGAKLSSAPSLPEVQLSQYVPSLEKLATLKLLQQNVFQMSKMYQTIRITYLAQMIPFFDFSVVEKISVDAVKNNFVAMKVDHVKGVVVFGNLVLDQGIELDCLRNPLAIFGETMSKVRAMLFPALSKASKLGDIVPNLEESVETEHKRLLARKSIIEKRKEEQERLQFEMEREEEQINLKLL